MGPLLTALLRPGSKLLLSGAKRYSNNSAPIVNPSITVEEIMPLLNTKFRRTTPISVDAADDVLQTLKAGFPLGRTKGIAEKDALYNIAKKFHSKSNISNQDVTVILKALTDKTKNPAEFPLFNAIKKEMPNYKGTMSENQLALYLKNYDKPLRELEAIVGVDKKTMQNVNNAIQPGGVVNLKLKDKLQNIIGQKVDFNKLTGQQVLKKKYKGDVNAANTATKYQIPKRTELLDESINTSNKVLTAAKKTFPKDLIQKEDFIGPIQKSRTVRGHGMGQEFFSKNLTTMSDKQVKKMFNLNSKDYTAIKDFTLAKENSGAYLRAAQKIKDNPSLANKINAIEKMRDPQFITSSTQNALHRKIEPRLNEAYFKKQTANKKGNFNFSNKLQTEIETYDAILKEARIPSFVWDDAAGQLKYYGAFPESTSKFANLAKGIQGTTPKGFFNNPKFKDGGRVGFELGGIVGGKEKFGGVSGSNFKGIGQTNKVGTIHSMLAGIGAGIIDIPKGAFSLGASLVDLGLGTDHAAKVEKFFNDLTNLDEKAEESFAGEMTRIITNLGIPGSQAFKIGSRLTKQALVARKKNQYFDLTDKKMEARMQDALNAGGRLLTTAGGAAGIGVSDAIFVGDPEQVGTIGDMFGGGPTALNPNDEDNAAREVMNRMKFGLESSLLAGIIGGTGSAIKTAVKRSGERDYANSTIDKIFSKFRPRGSKPQQFFDMERGQIGIRQADVNRAQEIQRGVDKHIDAIFPQLKNTFNKTTQETRSKLLKDLNETLLSGDPEISGVTGEFKFGAMDPSLLSRDTARLRKLGAKNPKAIFDSFYDMRAEWNDMFSALGTRMDPKSRAEFGKTFGQKMSDYLGSTYEIFQNKGLIPITQFKPGEEALAKATAMFKQSAKEAGEEITDEQAQSYANQVIKSARLPKGIATGSEKSSNAYFKAPDFFINKTVLSDLEFKGMVNLAELTPESRKVIDNLLGKIEDPTQTILGGTARLSMITRRNQFLDDLLKASDEAKVDKKDGFFYTDEREAINVFGAENVKKIEMDPGKTLEAGKTNPLNGLYAHKGVAEALEQTSQNILGESALANVYTNFILYPKAASQLAKTVLSPVTHVRNFVSAGAFAAGNGIIPNAEAFKTAYKSLQVPLKGSREQNEFYRKLLRLGVVNSNVRLGDLQNLLSDVKFGSSSATIPGLRRLAKQGSRLKKGAEEFYTAEDDFWKITSFAMERQRYADAYKKSGIVKSADELDEIAADIVRNNIPNYDYVNDFVKGLRKFPIGNFVSFPAEIMRTSGNILHRAFKEINFKQTLADGRVIKPLSGIGYKRLMGFGATAVVIPTGVVEGAKAIYDVSGAEMDALRRFVPDWSKNSTLIPIRDEDGSLKYIDFSHANAYDTMIRPFMTMKNAIQDGAEDEAPVMQSVFKGLYEGIGETISPFVSEAIWTQAATDIFLRGGRTKTGQRLYTDQTPFGEKASIIASHLVETQLPGSIGTFERLGLAVTSKPDEYGREYELTDEALGFMGMRAVKVDPITSMKFKIADYTTGVNNSRREFTRPLLKGGPVTPEQIVDRYMVANEQLFNVQKNMNKDYYAARILGSNQDALNLEFKDRISNVALNAIKAGQFKPFIPSENILKSFAENARNIGQTNPYENARATIDRLARQYSKANVMFGEFPFNDNPFTKVEESSLPTSGMGDTNVTLPNLGLNIQGSNLGNVNNLGTTLAKLEQVDKVFDL